MPKLSRQAASARAGKIKPKAVIFDMDGVIIDSMPYHFLAWYEVLRPYGVRVSCFDVYSKEGEKWSKTLKSLLIQAGIKPTTKLLTEIFSRRQRIFRKLFQRFIFNGAQELLSSLKKQGYLLGLVTGSPRKEVNTILPRSIISKFQVIVAGDEVRMGKPDPQPYLRAASLFGLQPKDCLVVENAPLGIESAKKAGMFCVAITTSLPKEYLRKADLIVDNLKLLSLCLL
ncbi:MAG: HAD family phosphatase [Candidatus Omnitrophota bacterium]|nr:HAD family phosphatase [Candidatus Omnitrophota bacterium]